MEYYQCAVYTTCLHHKRTEKAKELACLLQKILVLLGMVHAFSHGSRGRQISVYARLAKEYTESLSPNKNKQNSTLCCQRRTDGSISKMYRALTGHLILNYTSPLYLQCLQLLVSCSPQLLHVTVQQQSSVSALSHELPPSCPTLFAGCTVLPILCTHTRPHATP